MSVYEDGQDRAIVANVSFDPKSRLLVFGLLTAQQPMDFSRELEFQWAKIFCEANHPYANAAIGAAQNLEYARVVCHVLGPIPGMQPPTSPAAPAP
jgi:hypothetical protein